MTDNIKIELTETNFLTRWPCHVCGGTTEKDSVLAEGEQDMPSDGLPGRKYRTVRVCHECLRGDGGLSIDQRLENFALRLEAEAALTRAMIGKLQVPSYAEWEAACRVHGEALEREYAEASA